MMPLNLKTSKVWIYFDLKKARGTIQTLIKNIIMQFDSTVGLKRHLEKIHDSNLSKEEEPSNKKRCVQLTIDSMTKKVS